MPWNTGNRDEHGKPQATHGDRPQTQALKPQDPSLKPTASSVHGIYFFKLSGSAAPPIASAKRPPSTGSA